MAQPNRFQRIPVAIGYAMLLLGASLPLPGWADASADLAKNRIAVFPFRYSWQEDAPVGDIISTHLRPALTQSKSAIVMERTEIEKILGESGLDIESVIKSGQLGGIVSLPSSVYFLFGDITLLQVEKSRNEYKIEAKLTYRLVDSKGRSTLTREVVSNARNMRRPSGGRDDPPWVRHRSLVEEVLQQSAETIAKEVVLRRLHPISVVKVEGETIFITGPEGYLREISWLDVYDLEYEPRTKVGVLEIKGRKGHYFETLLRVDHSSKLNQMLKMNDFDITSLWVEPGSRPSNLSSNKKQSNRGKGITTQTDNSSEESSPSNLDEKPIRIQRFPW
jgi:hypothetical protein